MWMRILIACAVIVPAAMRFPPWWQLMPIAAGGFIAGRLVDLGVEGLDGTKRRQAALVLLAGLVLALVTFGLGAWPRWPRWPTRPLGAPVNRLPEVAPPAPVTPPQQRAGTWRAISIADRSACAIRDDRTVWCWGSVAALGNGVTDPPQQVAGLAGATAISVGAQATCVLVARTAWCFGWNYNGTLGVSPTDSHDLRREPVRVPIDEPLAAIAVAGDHACALAASGAVLCWGRLLRATVTDEAERERAEVRGPTRVAIAPARAITAGAAVDCAILRDATLTCWGDLDAPGSYRAPGTQAGPAAIAGLHAIETVSAGMAEVCVASREMAPTCWGTGPALRARIAQADELRAANKLPPLRPHTNSLGLVPRYDALDATNEALAAVPGNPAPRELHAHPELAGASQLAVGDMHACALVGGEALCWGSNYQGQLGDGTRIDSPTRAVTVAELPELASLAIGEFESCGLTTSGALWCWGHEELPRR